MTQTDVVTRMVQAAVLRQRQVARALRALTAHLEAPLSRGDWDTLAGFGTFAARRRGARIGRNPRSGQTLAIPTPPPRPGREGSRASKPARELVDPRGFVHTQTRTKALNAFSM
jgi:DNA-binding protein HU-beta